MSLLIHGSPCGCPSFASKKLAPAEAGNQQLSTWKCLGEAKKTKGAGQMAPGHQQSSCNLAIEASHAHGHSRGPHAHSHSHSTMSGRRGWPCDGSHLPPSSRYTRKHTPSWISKVESDQGPDIILGPPQANVHTLTHILLHSHEQGIYHMPRT